MRSVLVRVSPSPLYNEIPIPRQLVLNFRFERKVMMLWLPLLCWGIVAVEGVSTEYGVPSLNFLAQKDQNEQRQPLIAAFQPNNQGQGISLDFHGDQKEQTVSQPIQENQLFPQPPQALPTQSYSLPPLAPSPVPPLTPILPLPQSIPLDQYGLPQQKQTLKLESQVVQQQNGGIPHISGSQFGHQTSSQFIDSAQQEIAHQPAALFVGQAEQPQSYQPVRQYTNQRVNIIVPNYSHRPLTYLPAPKQLVGINAAHTLIPVYQPTYHQIVHKVPDVRLDQPHRHVVILQKHQAPGRADISTASFLTHSLQTGDHQTHELLPQIPQSYHGDSNSGSISSSYISKDVNNLDEFRDLQQSQPISYSQSQSQEVQQISADQQTNRPSNSLTTAEINQPFSKYGVPNV